VFRSVAFLAAAVVTMSAMPALAEPVTLAGEVTYRERIAMPEGATLRIRLIDLTAPGMPTRVEAEAAVSQPGQVPLGFTLNFDDRVIAAGHEHALVAEISANLQLWFRNSEPYRLDPLAPAQPLLIIANFVGRIVPTPAPERAPVEVTATPLFDVTWRATAIGDLATAPGVDSTLSIASDMRAGGRGGCNSYFSQASINGESIRLSSIAATLMACTSEQATEQERLFFEALGATRFWRITDETMVLMGPGGQPLVTFERSLR
jgi:putative lipoprotein